MSALHLRDELASLRIERQRPKRRWMQPWTFGLAALGLLAAGASAAAWRYRDALLPAAAVRTGIVRVAGSSEQRTVLTATGYLESRLQASVGAKAPGRLAQIHFDEGTHVEAKDLLAVLEHADLDAQLASRQVSVAQAKAELLEAQNLHAQAQRDVTRERDVFARNAGTKAGLERAETELAAAEARLAAREAAVAFAEAQVRESEEMIRNMYVYAPFAGTIISKDAEVGETIMPGGMGAASGRGSVATLANLSDLQVDTDVKEDYLGQLRRGQPAEIVVDAVSDRRYQGRLREIIPMGDRSRGVVKVKVTVLEPDERLFPELSATVHFLPPEGEPSRGDAERPRVFAPADALQPAGEKTFVWLVETGRVRRQEVATDGPARDGFVPIARGLTGGETVVLDPSSMLREGQRVTTGS